ncbi:MAG: GNAT family N-acetyltransferase [Polyangiaceae bacterium]|nr:GNAT family N-acetyltransferase [Myxococcales bacterium]MCB9589865.1 GNAT family N-acetyltransferase [Polyangiaceae bacterium]
MTHSGKVEVYCRKATKSDLPEVLRLYAQPELDDGKTLPLAEAERVFAKMLSYPDYSVYIACANEVVVGTFALLIMDNLAYMAAPSAVIEDVAVDPERHGEGIGQAMMHFALDVCREKGCYKAILSSNVKRTRAHAFYEQLGFEHDGYAFRVDL